MVGDFHFAGSMVSLQMSGNQNTEETAESENATDDVTLLKKDESLISPNKNL